jgi:hypothetical protein
MSISVKSRTASSLQSFGLLLFLFPSCSNTAKCMFLLSNRSAPLLSPVVACSCALVASSCAPVAVSPYMYICVSLRVCAPFLTPTQPLSLCMLSLSLYCMFSLYLISSFDSVSILSFFLGTFFHYLIRVFSMFSRLLALVLWFLALVL